MQEILKRRAYWSWLEHNLNRRQTPSNGGDSHMPRNTPQHYDIHLRIVDLDT